MPVNVQKQSGAYYMLEELNPPDLPLSVKSHVLTYSVDNPTRGGKATNTLELSIASVQFFQRASPPLEQSEYQIHIVHTLGMSLGVDSFHINVQQGDSAIHLLVKYDRNKPDVRTVQKAILIDGGKGGTELTANIHKTLLEIPNLKTGVRWVVPGQSAKSKSSLKLDAIIITHWDLDHCVGLATLLQQDIETKQEILEKKKPPGVWKPDEWQPDFLKYGTPKDRSEPLTKVYAPYWKGSGKGNKKKSAHYEKFREKDDGYLGYLAPLPSKNGKRPQPQPYDNVADLRYGGDILGMEFFGESEPNDPAEDIESIVELLAAHNNPAAGSPGMYCIASNQRVIGKTQPSLEDPSEDDAFPTSGKQIHVDAPEIVDSENSTPNNQASIACIILWGDQQLSHYFAGDLDDPREVLLAEWTGADGSPEKGKCVTSMKAGHHGSYSSTPPEMLKAFSPENIIVSAGADFGHPRWELLAYINLFYELRRLQATFNPTKGEYRKFEAPVYSTVFPYWFAKNTSTRKFVVPARNKVSTKAFDDPKKYDIYQENFRNLYDEYTKLYAKAVNSAQVPASLLDEYKAETWTGPKEAQRVAKLQFITARMNAVWAGISRIGPSAYPVSSLQNAFYGASQSVPLAREEIQYLLVESRQKQWRDGTVRIRRSGSSAIITLRDNWNRAKPKLAPKLERRVDVPSWTGHIFGGTTVVVPTPTLTGSLPNDISVLTSASSYLDGDEDPGESDPEDNDDSDDALVRKLKLPAPPAFNALTAEPGFYYCSSRAPGESGPGVTVSNLPSGSDLDDFTYALHSGVVALVQVPSPTASQKFLEDDEWNIWWKAALNSSSLFAFGDETKITSFGTSIQFGKYTLTFDTTSIAANFPPPSDPMFSSLIVDKNMTILGLNPLSSNDGKPMEFNLSDIYSAIGISDAPSISLNVTLDPNAKQMRNAIWFWPQQNYMTTLRLVFSIDENTLDNLNVFFHAFKFKVASGFVIGVRTYNWRWDGVNSKSASLAYSLTFNIDAFTSPVLGALVFESEITQIIINCDGNDWESWVKWVLGILGLEGDPGSDFPSWFHTILHSDKLPQPRRIQFTLDASNNIQDCQFDFGVTLGVGSESSSSPNPIVILSFFWSENTGIEIKGNLWTGQPYSTLDNKYLPSYETYNDLSLGTEDPAPSLSLASLFPNVSVTGIPKSIIPQVVAATFSISSSKITFYGQLETNPPSSQSGVPQMPLALLSLNATFSPSDSVFTLDLELNVLLQGKKGSQSPPALLAGSLSYTSDADPPWWVEAEVQDLSIGTLYEFFDSDSQNGANALLGEFAISSLKLDYHFGSKDSANDFEFTGTLLLGILELDLTYNYPASGEWDFTATLTIIPEEIKDMTVQSLVAEISNDIVLPGFVGQILLSSLNTTLSLHAEKLTIMDKKFVFFLTKLNVGDFEILYVQYHTDGWEKPKRMFRAAITTLPKLDNVPIVSELVQPFDEMYFLYVSIDSSQPIQGISFAELKQIKNFFLAQKSTSPILAKTSLADPKDTDVAITPGLHFVVVADENKQPTAILDYAFSSAKTSGNFADTQSLTATTDPDDGPASVGSLKKSFGPLTISNLGLQYKSGVLSVLLDATFKLGPIELDLIGFTLGVDLSGGNLMKFPDPIVGLNGVGVSFNQPPTSLVGLFEKLDDLYEGGIEVSFAPYKFLAAGCYGTIKGPAGDFKTVAIFGKLDGPLVELEFAEISGICGGFGYNSLLKLPTADQVINFPLVGDNTKPGKSETALDIIKGFTSGGWITPTRDDLWLAAGLKVTALQTLNVNAVVVVEFAESIKLGIFADCVASFPPGPSEAQFVYVELGISAVADFGTGTLVIEGKLAPTSFIFDPSCHLSGGFALCYWFDPSGYAGDWVFTVGGYHPAYSPQPNYPKPDRLAISWNLDSISIVGQSYFAITPKACMGGGSLQASLSLGPLYAYFDAWADFLMNYHPFYFVGDIGVTVGVKFTLDLWICTIHINIEIGASLHIEGPTVHGTVHVDFWVFGFDINFGGSHPRPDPLRLEEFYTQILQQKGTTKTSAHTITCESGLVPQNSVDTVVPAGSPWNVRGSGFVCGVTSPFAFTSAEVTEGGGVQDIQNLIYSRPMHTLKGQELTSGLTITVEDSEGTNIAGFEVREIPRNLPKSIWAPYCEADDPLTSGNQIPSLLSGDSPTIPLMVGVQLTAPAPEFAPDEIPPFDIKVALTDLVGKYTQGQLANADNRWLPDQPQTGAQQWIDVRKDWLEGSVAAQSAADEWIKVLGWGGKGIKLNAAAPHLLLRDEETFETYYLSAPMISVG